MPDIETIAATMAMMDNRAFLLTHIRHSFITSDDTSMCELIMENEAAEKPEKRQSVAKVHGRRNSRPGSSVSDSELNSSTEEICSSFDIVPDMDYGAHRRRSNTAQRLDKLKKERRNQVKPKNIPWKEVNIDYNPEEISHLFEKKDISTDDARDKSRTSAFSKNLQNFSSLSDNPFLDYAKFDGKSNVGLATKKLDIYLTMAASSDRSYPMTIVVVATAKVQDLVGLICWQYTHEKRQPTLHKSIQHYCLHIAEDDGEVDMDFPSLDSREPMSKFGFGKLAIVEKAPTSPTPKTAVVVTINVPGRGFNKFQLDNLIVPVKVLLEKVLKRRKIQIKPGMHYNLEKQSEPGVALDPETMVSTLNTIEFCLVRQHSSRGDSTEELEENTVAEPLTSHQYKSYHVELVHRLRANTDIQLGISGDKVEIYPLSNKGVAKIFRQKPITYEAENLANCELLGDKESDKSPFRLTCVIGHDYRHHDFEADTEVAEEIVQKVNNILDLRLSPVRKEYVTEQEKKIQKKREAMFH